MKNMIKEAIIFKNRIKRFDVLAYASMLLVILVVGYPRETSAAPTPKDVIVVNDPLNVAVVNDPVNVAVVNEPVDVTVVNSDPPVSVGSYFFSQTATSTGTGDEVIDSKMVGQTILITGVDIITLVASGSRCTWFISRDTADTAGVSGITTSTTLIFHVASEPGTMHHEFAQPARVSATQSFHISATSLGNGSCGGSGIMRFVLD